MLVSIVSRLSPPVRTDKLRPQELMVYIGIPYILGSAIYWVVLFAYTGLPYIG